MVVSPRKRLILPVAPAAGAGIGVLAAGLFLLLPTGALESLVVDSGVAAILSAAEPPLGLTARAVLALLCGGGLGAATWFAAFLAVGTRSVVLQPGSVVSEVDADAPVLRRADAHPDAPARRPLFANRDLGTPFLDVRAPVHVEADAFGAEGHKGHTKTAADPEAEAPIEAASTAQERSIPVDLDEPLAAYDPAAMAVRPVSPTPRLQTFAPGERLETYALRRPARPAPAPAAAPIMAKGLAPYADPSETIHALLDRLERGVTRRETNTPPPLLSPRVRASLEDTLSSLRNLAVRVS